MTLDIQEQIDEYEKIYPEVDLHSEPGTKVVFSGRGGYPKQNKLAHQHLEIGKTYTLAGLSVGGWESTFYLEGFEGIGFNSVLFCPEGWIPPEA